MIGRLLALIPSLQLLAGVWAALTSRLGLMALAGLAGLLAGLHFGSNEIELAALRGELAAARIDLDIARAMESDWRERTQPLEAARQTDEGRIRDLQAQLERARQKGRPDPCVLDGSRARSLRPLGQGGAP